jgi:hypothetical protein
MINDDECDLDKCLAQDLDLMAMPTTFRAKKPWCALFTVKINNHKVWSAPTGNTRAARHCLSLSLHAVFAPCAAARAFSRVSLDGRAA